MNYRQRVLSLALVISTTFGWAMTPLVRSVRNDYVDPNVQTEVSSLSESLGQGISIAVLGGYRNVAANLVWISMYPDWQALRKEEVLTKIRLAAALNPSSDFFWIFGSRIIANDMPVWEVDQRMANTLKTTPEGNAILRKYGRMALAHLNQAPEPLQESQPMLREKGIVSWQRLEDLPLALTYFERAVSQPNAPYYLSRVYAEILIKNGEIEKALKFLKRHYEGLPDGNVHAAKPLVAQRILDLERMIQEKD